MIITHKVGDVMCAKKKGTLGALVLSVFRHE